MNDIKEKVPYDRFISLCEDAGKRHGNILQWPIGKQPYEYIRLTYQNQYPNGRVLDFGCGAKKPLKATLGLSDEHYLTCDSDPSGSFSFATPDLIPEGEMFDIIAANQVLEHLTFDDAIQIAITLAKHLKPGGIFQIGVPNTSHPTRYLSSPVHISPWNYLNLCAIMEIAGLDPFYGARYNKFPAPPFYMRPLVNFICKTFRIDWCDSIYVVGRQQGQ